ncbi:hypothetical protein [Liquorilactobacillus cacaonum]|uniref:Uncharacterized protein n=1 Tax=Liquorilactobacillus cacaonum DSM 21116 TaxID=1423729 RepID=A0A0R2CSJ6_9LACO|nr:hypothetical protein [Liquorilactobacillus cacaonum]KRM90659.1 hypothetical protein FC80_GL000649 [Liquorilactobacillus cacaonum DSM 21116]
MTKVEYFLLLVPLITTGISLALEIYTGKLLSVTFFMNLVAFLSMVILNYAILNENKKK